MVKISKDLIDSLSKLAKINLTKEQEEKYAGEFSSVMGYMEEIKNINVDHIQETSRVAKEENVLREDVVKESLSQKEALKNSKNTNDGYFLVPAIFKED
ncbi:MAG: Asp-tRNA(Asn)/Glu-tRNA(Gln) amidotransferase subunit GatC [Candidatus Roizmanbacteria bacterium]|jgi:aspartyl-tRNA(Asn)/glutamyl-tRNA(Gln) amidotransferase subunit C|nr:Asp-tRNA(Asn)/Glu-tRNA(Gln) amidotransferase subunit GatC [Candidatus Roizmanbacteria bacterium]